MTNYEKIKSMSVEEMARFIGNTPSINSCEFCFYGGDDCFNIRCSYGVKKWLEQEADDNDKL